MNTLIISAISFILILSFSPSPALAQNLNILWDKTYSDSLLGRGFAFSAVPIHDGLLIAGERYSPVSGSSGLLIKTDQNGDMVWRKFYPDIIHLFITKFDDSLLLIHGRIKPKSEYDITPDIFVGLMDFNGNIRWIHRFTYWEHFNLFAKRNGGICALGRITKDTTDLMAVQLNSKGDSISTHHFSFSLYSDLGGYSFILPNNKIVITGVIIVGMPFDKCGTDYPIDPVIAIVDLDGTGSIHQQKLALDWTNDKVISHKIGKDYFDLLIARRYWADSDSLRRGPDTTGLGVYRFDYSGNYTLITSTTSPIEKTQMVGSAKPLPDGSWVGYGVTGINTHRLIHMNSKGDPVVYGAGTPFSSGSIYNIAVYDSSCVIVSGISSGNIPRSINVCLEPEVTDSPLDRSNQERPVLTIRSGSLCIDYHKSHHPTRIEVYDLQGKKLQSIDTKEASDQIVIPFYGYPHGAYYAIIKTDQEVYTYPFYH